MINKKIKAIIYAFTAALLYALNIPISKLLLKNVEPVFMAALLYFGAGLGMGFLSMFHKKNKSISKKDLPYVLGMIFLDSLAPIFLMLGVSLGTSSDASLIGNFEITATTLIAMLFFGEKISKHLWTAIILITLSSLLISYDGNSINIFSLGSLSVLAATLCWGLENNCTKSISDKDTYEIVTIKGIFSGLCSLVIALTVHEKIPEIIYIFPALILGFLAYGLSIFTYIRAQETLGAAKTGAYYATAPFIGAIFSFVILRETLTVKYSLAFLIMSAGTLFAIYDTLRLNHSHEHIHKLGNNHVIIHSHAHNHFLHLSEHSHKHYFGRS